MSQMARHPAYLLVEDQLDAVGQKYRVQQILRGGMLFLAGAVLASLGAALAAHILGTGSRTWIVFAIWAVWIALSGAWWVGRPMLLRPKVLQVARLVEKRIAGLNNGLTNSVLLARADDLQESPWLPPIFDEILSNSRGKSLDAAVKLRDLRPLGVRLACIVVPAVLLAILLPTPFVHGWQQMFNPTHFVPQTGSMKIVEVKPGDVTLVKGQPLEIAVVAEGPGTPEARLIFDGDHANSAVLPPTSLSNSQVRYTYRIEHTDEPMKYRVEVGDSQSSWYQVKLVQEVKLTELVFNVTPPSYTGQGSSSIQLKQDQIGSTPVNIRQGSRVELIALTDVPVNGAMLQLAKNPPVALQKGNGGQRFFGSFVVLDDTPLVILLTAGGEQIIATVPEPPLIINCTKDAAPQIEMKWPMQDVNVDPKAELKVQAVLRDDYGVAEVRVLTGAPEAAAAGNGQTAAGAGPVMNESWKKQFDSPKGLEELSHLLEIPPELRRHGQTLFVQVEVTDNRNLSSVMKEGGRQTTSSQRYQIQFRDPQQIAREEKDKADKLRARLLELLKLQQDWHGKSVAFKAGDKEAKAAMKKIGGGQTELRSLMQQTAETFEFDQETKVVQKTLLVLVYNPAKEAIDLATAILTEPAEKQQTKLNSDLQSKQRKIISTLESLLALLNVSPEPATQPTTREGADLQNEKEQFEKLKEALKEFMKEEQRIMDQTAPLAKKPVDNWDEKDKKLLEELNAAQEKLDAFMQEKVHDFSKLAEQDMANASLLKELMEVYSEVTMAKDALKKQAAEIAVAAEEMGLELAKELNANLEKWLMDSPDRAKWTQEDPVGKQDVPMAELPKELEDMIGELMEEQEDLFDEMEDANANWTDSMDKGVGWDAADGPIANNSAKGVTGNQQPNNNEMAGRSGEGRSGKSQGEMVEDTATGKGGRPTPTRLDPTPFQQGQVKDESKDPVGGATGGGKLSGQGGQGLEGPLGPKMKDEELKRLEQKQTELRNAAERLNLQYQLGKYDNFKLLESIALMRRVESDLKSNRYQNALRRKDVLLDDMETSQLLLSGRIHVQHDTSPTMSKKLEGQINDAMKGQLPAQWSEPLKEYYKKLSAE